MIHLVHLINRNLHTPLKMPTTMVFTIKPPSSAIMPSVALLRALFKAAHMQRPCPNYLAQQVRHSSIPTVRDRRGDGYKREWMPREHYAKRTPLDRLHKKQKAEKRQEREDSRLRAEAMQMPSWLRVAAGGHTGTSGVSTVETAESTPISISTPTIVEPEQSTPASLDPSINPQTPLRFSPTEAATLSEQPQSSSSPTTSTQRTVQLPYSLTRAGPSRNYPVYEKAKANGGTLHVTTIRRLSGDLQALQAHLCEALGLVAHEYDRLGKRRENVWINWNTRHVHVKGWRGAEVRRWMELVGL